MTNLEIWHEIQRQSPALARDMKSGKEKEFGRAIKMLTDAFGELAGITIERYEPDE